jgi:hypothetical protein
MSADLSLKAQKAESNTFSNVNLGKLCTLMVVYASFYYPLGAFIIIQLGVPSTPVNVGFRAVAAITATLLILFFLLNQHKHLRLNKSLWLLLAWWIYYGARILFDLARGVKFSTYGNEFIYGITYGNIFLPIIAVVLWREYIDLVFFKKWSFIFIFASCVLILIVVLKQAESLNMDIFLQRLDLVNNKGKARQSSVLNPIALGFYGELLLLLSFFRILFSKYDSKTILYLIGIIIGFLLLLFGASRGPFLSCGLVIVILVLNKFSFSRSKVVLLLKYVLYILSASIILSYTLLRNVSIKDFTMFNRIIKFAEDRQARKVDTRDIHIAHAWQDFLDSPLFGKQFVGTLDNFYPHNIIVEVFMASGLIGAFMFFPLMFYTLFVIYKYLRSGQELYMIVAIIFLPCYFFLFTSGSLFQSVEYWLLSCLVIVVYQKFKPVNI